MEKAKLGQENARVDPLLSDALSLVDVARRRGREHPDQRAFVYLADGDQEEETLTFGELDRRAAAVAAFLQQYTEPGDRVVLLFSTGIPFYAMFLGCMYAGVIAVPAYPPRPHRMTSDQNLRRLQGILRDARPALAVTTETLAGRLRNLQDIPELAALRVVAYEEIPTVAPADYREYVPSPDDIAFLQYTSGSTRDARGVMVSNENLMTNQRLMRDAFEYGEPENVMGWLPLYHDLGLIGNLLIPLYLGSEACLMSPFSFLQKPVRWLRAISRYGAAVSGGPNFAFDLCANRISEEDKKDLDLSHWTHAFIGAEPVRAATLDRFSEAFASCGFRRESFMVVYGLAEQTLGVACGKRHESPIMRSFDRRGLELEGLARPGTGAVAAVEENVELPAYHPYPDIKIVAVDPETERELPPGQIGELWLKGPNRARGYWGVPEISRATFEARIADTDEGPFVRTGDLGFLLDDEMYITGREKDLIIMKGRNYYAHDFELSAEHAHPLVMPAAGAAFGVAHAEEGERLYLVQEVSRRCGPDQFSEVLNAIRDIVAREHDVTLHGITLIIQGSIPRTSSGKIQRGVAARLYRDKELKAVTEWSMQNETTATKTQAAQAGETPGARELTHWIIGRLAAKLKVNPDEVRPDQPFAYWGLDSVVAVDLVAELETKLGRKLAPTILFEYPDVAALVSALVDRPSSEANSAENVATSTARASADPSRSNPAGAADELGDLLDELKDLPAEDVSQLFEK